MKSWKKKFTAFIVAVAAALGITIGVDGPTPTPTPSPVPTVQPTASPTTPPTPTPPVPTAVPTASPTAAPTPVPTVAPYPVRFPLPTATVYMRNHRYNAGVDSTPRVRGDRELCESLHHVPVPSGDCHFDSDVWVNKEQRGQYEAQLLGGCPVWQVRGLRVERCHNNQNAQHSCDHFGNVVDRDDPQTGGIFEGRPESCGLQVDEYGPYAGFFMIPHKGDGKMEVRACKPNEEGDEGTCAPWLEVTWR